jgi:hypothetical protein
MMLSGDDVLDLERQEGQGLWHLAICAAVMGALPDQLLRAELGCEKVSGTK